MDSAFLLPSMVVYYKKSENIGDDSEEDIYMCS
jgi:hypothetical protein